MKPERLMAITDGVVAVIITIMVLEMKPPHGARLSDLREVAPVFASYVLSFVYVAIYWNNHHHFFQLVPKVTGGILWSNIALLFWISLIPFSTAWASDHPLAPGPTALYGLTLLAAALGWWTMQVTLLRALGPDSELRRAIGLDRKGRFTPILYVLGVSLAFVAPLASYACYLAVALFWLAPDRRVERALGARAN